MSITEKLIWCDNCLQATNHIITEIEVWCNKCNKTTKKNQKMRTIKYESEKTVLPDEIMKMIDLCQGHIKRDMPEDDKVFLNVESLRGSLIRWFANHEN